MEILNWPEPWLWSEGPVPSSVLTQDSCDHATLCELPSFLSSSSSRSDEDQVTQEVPFLLSTCTHSSSFKEPYSVSDLVKTKACFYNLYQMAETQNKFNNI
jgi:hypothetical protein